MRHFSPNISWLNFLMFYKIIVVYNLVFDKQNQKIY